MVLVVNRRCSAGAGEVVCISVGCGLAMLTLSGKAPHITAGSNSGSSSLTGIKGELSPSRPLSDLLLSKASNDSSVNNEDCSHEESFS